MRVVNEDGVTIVDYDLTIGELTPAVLIREDAIPPDYETKFAWADEDYEDVLMYRPYYSSDTPLDTIKTSKIQEMSATCNNVIISGIWIGANHYSLGVEDQINMMSLQAAALSGQSFIPYHADGEECRFYSAEEFLAISQAATQWKIYQESYFNSLRIYIGAMTTVQEIVSLQYGDPIPEEYQTDVLKELLAQMVES